MTHYQLRLVKPKDLTTWAKILNAAEAARRTPKDQIFLMAEAFFEKEKNDHRKGKTKGG